MDGRVYASPSLFMAEEQSAVELNMHVRGAR